MAGSRHGFKVALQGQQVRLEQVPAQPGRREGHERGTDVEDQLARQAPLNGEVDHVATTDLKLRIVLEAQYFTKALIRYYGRLKCAGGQRSWNLAIYANTKNRTPWRRVGTAICARSARFSAVGRFNVNRLGEADAELTLPVEIRNDIARLEIAGERSAGAVQLGR